MAIREISFLAYEAKAEGGYERDRNMRNLITVEVKADTDQLVAQLSIEEILDYCDKDFFLDAIGEEYVKHYFDLISA